MNTLPSDTNENTTDIFVLSGSSSVASPLKDSLEEGGYRVTLFTDGTQLLESLQAGIPNLLICDATSDETAAYDTCRQIKADDNLWMIPVLILSRTNGLSDLLSVLDCNADNFIAYPCDPPFLISLVEGMLVTPVERQTAEMVKTQFRIQHDGKVYVVTADRRKLLELLLSSFETAVSISSYHSQSREEVQQLTGEGIDLREKLLIQTRTADGLRQSLQKKEESERSLSQQLETREQELAAKASELSKLQKDLDDDRTLIAAAEEHIRTMLQQKDEMLATHRTETTAMVEQVSALSTELDTIKAVADRLKRELEEQTKRREEYERALREIVPQKDAADNALRVITLEAEQLKSALAEEQNRAASGVRELGETRRAGAKRDQDLGREITVLKERTIQQDAEIGQLKSELGVETKRAITAYESLTALQSEKEQSEAAFRAGADSLKQQLAAVQEELDSTVQVLTEEKRGRTTADADLADTVAEKERMAEQIRDISANLGQVSAERKRFEDSYRTATSALEDAQSALDTEKARGEEAEERVQASLREKEGTARALREALDEAGRNLGIASARISALETELVTASREQEESEHTHRAALEAAGKDRESRTAEIDRAKQDLIGAQTRISELEEELKNASWAHKDAVEEHREALGSANRDLDRRSTELERVRAEAGAFSARVLDLEGELKTATRTAAESGQQARSLGEELEQIKAELVSERRLHREDGEKLLQAISEKEKLKQEFLKSAGRMEETGAVLAAERELRIAAETTASTAQQENERIAAELEDISGKMKRMEEEYSDKIEDLSANLVRVLKEQRSLEQQLESVTSERRLTEQKMASLSSEIEQARVALADEWENHMNADEQLAAASSNNIQLQQAEQKLDDLAAELQQARAALADEWEDHMNANERLEALGKRSPSFAPLESKPPVERVDLSVRESGLPVLIRPRSTSLAKVDIPPLHAVHDPEEMGTGQEPAYPAGTAYPAPEKDVRSAADIPLEDLFEDPEPAISPVNPPIVTPQPEKPDTGYPQEITEEENEDEAGPEEESEPEEEESGEPTPESYTPGTGAISFNRQQWFDLFTWARHADALTTDQRMEIIRMGRLIQRGRKLTQKQDARVREMIELVQSLGYRLP
jgi:DNA-binding response OmpR family regulator